MNTRDQFGNYLLLKKLSEDGLGETFRAGKIGRQSLERVVLLRVYNGQGLDSERLSRIIQARTGLAQALKSPNVATAIDTGQVRGIPFVAYDYVSGRSLAQLSEQALKRGQPVPLDHALLIAERMASGLAVAYETRLGDDRVLHGFLTPQQVMVSHEGEMRLAGFEAAPGLRASAGHPVIKQSLGRYLPPEALAGQPPAKNDDVYSLAAILFEMLSGQPLPALPAAGIGTLADQVVVAADGGNLHPDLAALLKRSLCPREQRVGDVVAWHKSLTKLMSDGQYNPTTFNLAFFLHNLFRDEIERETQELETERTQAIQLPVPAAPSAPAPAAPAVAGASALRDSGPVRENTDVLREKYGIDDSKGSNKGVLIAAAVGGLAVLGVGAWFLFGRGPSATAPDPAATPAAVDPAAVVTPVAPVGPSPEEIQSQIAKMVEEQSKQLEAGFKEKYDEQMKALQKQLEDARKAETVRPAVPTPAPTLVSRSVDPVAAPVPTAPTQGAPSATAAPTTTAPATTVPAAVATTVAPGTAPTTTAPVEAAPALRVKVGDLVTMGPGVVPPRVTRKPALNYPPIAQRMKKEATVTVSVLVDENGRVADVRTVGAKAGFGMDEAASDYARACGWAPATKDGVKVRMWYDLKVAFTLSGRS